MSDGITDAIHKGKSDKTIDDMLAENKKKLEANQKLLDEALSNIRGRTEDTQFAAEYMNVERLARVIEREGPSRFLARIFTHMYPRASAEIIRIEMDEERMQTANTPIPESGRIRCPVCLHVVSPSSDMNVYCLCEDGYWSIMDDGRLAWISTR